MESCLWSFGNAIKVTIEPYKKSGYLSPINNYVFGVSMITEEIMNIKSGKKELRKFGITMGIVIACIGGFLWWREKEYYFYLLGVATAFLLLGLAIPFLLKPIHKFWMGLAVLMSWVMTRIILGILFYLGITPMSILIRLLRKDFLKLTLNKTTAKTYWIPKEKRETGSIDYEKQY